MQSILSIIEIATVVLFSVEYLLRIYIAPSRVKFIFSFMGIVDLAAILPFYLAPGLDRFRAGVSIVTTFPYPEIGAIQCGDTSFPSSFGHRKGRDHPIPLHHNNSTMAIGRRHLLL